MQNFSGGLLGLLNPHILQCFLLNQEPLLHQDLQCKDISALTCHHGPILNQAYQMYTGVDRIMQNFSGGLLGLLSPHILQCFVLNQEPLLHQDLQYKLSDISPLTCHHGQRLNQVYQMYTGVDQIMQNFSGGLLGLLSPHILQCFLINQEPLLHQDLQCQLISPLNGHNGQRLNQAYQMYTGIDQIMQNFRGGLLGLVKKILTPSQRVMREHKCRQSLKSI